MNKLIRYALTCVLLTALAIPALAQRPDAQKPVNDEGDVPEGWQVRLDRPNPDAVIGADKEKADIFFVNMTPGWHVTTGPAGIFYHPESTAEGTFRAETTIHLFDPGDRREAFGIFLGGQNLDADNQSYLYFLLRKNGEFLIKHRAGSETHVIQNWTAHDAIVAYGADTEGPVANTLTVEVSDGTVSFSVNGTEVASQSSDDLQTDGVVGLRINHALNVHVADLKVEGGSGS